MFTVSPHLVYNCWSASNYCCSPTSHFDVRMRSSTKNNSHTCTFRTTSASHFLLSRAPLGHLNIAQIIGGEKTTLFHTLLAFEGWGDTLAWVVDAYSILGIHHLQALQEASFHPKANLHLPQHFTRHNIECLFEVHKTTIEWFFLPYSVLLKFAIWRVS
jgi:hypothetical protein